MKCAIMSDVHANPVALETALADARALGCRKFLMLGDITGYGYDAKRALRLVRKNFDVVLMGNHDSACLGRENSRQDRVNPNYDQDRRQYGLLAKSDIEWLSTRSMLRVVDGMALVHGDFTKPEAWNYVYQSYVAEASLAARQEKLLFCGHTHHADVWEFTKDEELNLLTKDGVLKPATSPESIVFKRNKGSRYIVNVGSVGYPRNDLCATYVICDPLADSFILRRLPFDFKSYVAELLAHQVSLPNWLNRILLSAREG